MTSGSHLSSVLITKSDGAAILASPDIRHSGIRYTAYTSHSPLACPKKWRMWRARTLPRVSLLHAAWSIPSFIMPTMPSGTSWRAQEYCNRDHDEIVKGPIPHSVLSHCLTAAHSKLGFYDQIVSRFPNESSIEHVAESEKAVPSKLSECGAFPAPVADDSYSPVRSRPYVNCDPLMLSPSIRCDGGRAPHSSGLRRYRGHRAG
jgi:hypothetical protein